MLKLMVQISILALTRAERLCCAKVLDGGVDKNGLISPRESSNSNASLLGFACGMMSSAAQTAPPPPRGPSGKSDASPNASSAPRTYALGVGWGE